MRPLNPEPTGKASDGLTAPVPVPQAPSRFLPFPGASTREAWLRGILLVACLQSMGFTLPLWTNSRTYPVMPVAAWFPVLPAPWDRMFLVGMMASLVLAFWFYRSAVVGFLVGSLFLVLEDQNRLQPWFYAYGVLLWLSLLPEPADRTGCRLALSAIYFWAGLQKCNALFFSEVVPFFLTPFSTWLPAAMMPLVHLALSATPVIEVLIGFALWVPRYRRAALIAACAVHGMALLTIGPLGNNFNAVVWPWNVVTLALVFVLFLGRPKRVDWARFRSSAWGPAVVALFWGLPLLSYYGWWDSYLSFSVYSGNTARADIILSPAMKERLPASLQSFAHPLGRTNQSGYHGPFRFDFRNWGEAEVKVPPLPEPRSYLALARYLAPYAERPDDLRLILVPRFGSNAVYRASDLSKGR
jgi:hypothetical protein